MDISVSAFTLKHMSHFKLIFVYDMRQGSKFILLYMDTQFAQYHFLKRFFFLHGTLVKNQMTIIKWIISSFSVLFHLSIWLPLWQYHTGLITITLWWILRIIYLFIYLFMAVLGFRFCARASSSCGKWGPLFIAVRGPLTIAASLVAEHRLQTHRLSSCGLWAQLLHSMWDLPRPGLEPVTPALAGRFSTTVPPGKPLWWILKSRRMSPPTLSFFKIALVLQTPTSE